MQRDLGAIDIVASHMISRIPSPPSHHIMVIRDGNVANFVSRPPSTDKLEDLAAGRGASSAAWLVPAAALGPLLRRLLMPPAPQKKACAVTITISSDRPRVGGRVRMQRDLSLSLYIYIYMSILVYTSVYIEWSS